MKFCLHPCVFPAVGEVGRLAGVDHLVEEVEVDVDINLDIDVDTNVDIDVDIDVC